MPVPGSDGPDARPLHINCPKSHLTLAEFSHLYNPGFSLRRVKLPILRMNESGAFAKQGIPRKKKPPGFRGSRLAENAKSLPLSQIAYEPIRAVQKGRAGVTTSARLCNRRPHRVGRLCRWVGEGSRNRFWPWLQAPLGVGRMADSVLGARNQLSARNIHDG